MTKTLTGPRSFRATIVPPRCTVKSHVSCACEQPDTLEFDASDAVTKAVQRALFADYTATAKELGLVARKEAPPHGYSNLPNFTAAPFTANERHWLGREVGFHSYDANVFAPVAGGVRDYGAAIVHGVVWSRSPYGPAFWVYVEGSGFYSVREGDFLVGVNA